MVLAALFVAIAMPVLGTLPHDFDEAWFMLDARLIRRGLRPFVDFAHHETPLHLYLLTAAGEVFGPTVFGYRMVSLVSLAASGILLFWLGRPFAGPIPALIGEGVFLFSAVQARALTAVPETPALLFTLLGAVLLFTRDGRWAARAAGVAFVLAVLVKPTSLVVAVAATLGVAYAGQWRRLADFAVAGVVAAVAGLAWVVVLSDGIFTEVLRFQLERVGTHRVGMWAIDSGFLDMRRLGGIETPRQWAVVNFKSFFLTRVESTPIVVFALGLLAIPLWVGGVVRSRPALQAFVVLWPASYLLLNFVVMDFTSPRYFVPFFAFAAFLCAGWAWLVERFAGRWTVAAVGGVACVALAGRLVSTLGSDSDPWFWGRTDWIGKEHPRVVSFSPMFFAATGAEPGCEFANAALTYGAFGEAFLLTERTRPFRFSDDRLITCLRANPDMPVVVDWAFYFFTRPGSRLREYLAGEGGAQRLFFSPESVEQWDRPVLRMSPLR